MPRMKVFNALEEETFETPPVFNTAERKRYFTLPAGLDDLVETLRTPTNKVCFILAAGYFRARRKFFPQRFRHADVDFVAARLDTSVGAVVLSDYDRATAMRHQQVIAAFFGYRKFDDDTQLRLRREISSLVRSQTRPKLILLEAVQSLVRQKTVIPSYNVLAHLIIESINQHKRLLIRIVEERLCPAQRQLLDALLEKDVEASSSDACAGDDASARLNRYRLTLLKKSFQSTKPAKIKTNITDFQLLRGLYLELETAITALGLTHEGLRYFATSVIKAEVFQVTRRTAQDRYLHLLAFIAYQTFKLQDTLVETLLQAVQGALNTTHREHKELYYTERAARNIRLKELVMGLDQHLLQTISDIQVIVSDKDCAASLKVEKIAALLEANAPQQKDLEEHIKRLQAEVETAEGEGDYFQLLGRRSLKLQSRASDIVRELGLDVRATAPLLHEAIRYYQRRGGDLERNAPVDFLLATERAAIFNVAGKFQVSLYKVLLFTHVAEGIKGGKINLLHSHKYRSLDDYLIPQDVWDLEREELLQEASLGNFADCPGTLENLSQKLDDQHRRANRRLQEGFNPLLTMRDDGSFHLITPKQEESEGFPLSRFFPARRYVSLLEVLHTVQQATSFLDEFEHWQQTYQKPKPPEKTFFAGIIGYGCDIGQSKIAQISKQISENELENTINWYFALLNIDAANDRILSILDRLELPNLYRRAADKLHTSSDGQKFEVAVESLNANYSFKYFGQSKGVTVYSFIDERHLLFHSTVISSAEREAAYVIDGLMHNEVVKSDIHSTDTHGYSEIIFAVTHLLGFAFAPRIKHLGKQRLYSFEKRKVYEALKHEILPDAYIDTDLITEHWNAILRFIATIKLKHTTATQLFKRLNSYSKQHTLYRALKEFGKIIKSIFILKYIDDPEFRQSIEKQLNKIESAQKFSKAVSFGHNQEFMQGEKEEQEITAGCRRLIKNAIICWNYLYLSQLIGEAQTEEKRNDLVESIKHGSVVSWQHINLHGEYDFSDDKLQDSVGLDLTKIVGFLQGKKWEVKNQAKPVEQMSLPEIL